MSNEIMQSVELAASTDSFQARRDTFTAMAELAISGGLL